MWTFDKHELLIPFFPYKGSKKMLQKLMAPKNDKSKINSPEGI